MKIMYCLIGVLLIMACGTETAEVELRNFYDAGSIRLILTGEKGYELYASKGNPPGFESDYEIVEMGIYDWMMIAIKASSNDTVTGQVNINADKRFTVYEDFTYAWIDL